MEVLMGHVVSGNADSAQAGSSSRGNLGSGNAASGTLAAAVLPAVWRTLEVAVVLATSRDSLFLGSGPRISGRATAAGGHNKGPGNDKQAPPGDGEPTSPGSAGQATQGLTSVGPSHSCSQVVAHHDCNVWDGRRAMLPLPGLSSLPIYSPQQIAHSYSFAVLCALHLSKKQTKNVHK
ncbi:UNVERIFIED_CONTAM: hypothetical protein FKN15_045556 [Acipenser sinensis]